MNLPSFIEPIMALAVGLSGSESFEADLSSARLMDADPSDARFANVNMTGLATDVVNKTGMTIRRVEVSDLFAAYEKLKG